MARNERLLDALLRVTVLAELSGTYFEKYLFVKLLKVNRLCVSICCVVYLIKSFLHK